MRGAYLDTALRLGGPAEQVADVRDVVIARSDGGSLGARAYLPRAPAERLGAVVWLHGGGWCVGDLDGFDRVSRRLANAAGAVVVSIDYRLAPEHPYPAGVEDAETALRWAMGHGAQQLGFDPSLVAVGGDSAGGNLATVAARRAAGPIAVQLLVYPAVDASMDSASYREFADGPMLSAEDMQRCWRLYLGGRDWSRESDASPLHATDVSGAPPAFIAVAGHDPLRDDGVRYAEALRSAGVPVDLRTYEDMVHGFLRWGGVVDRAGELIDELGAAARAAFVRA
jgi:acetyl esterase/lipase